MNVYENKLLGWIKLAAAIACLWGFVFWVAPMMQELKTVKTMHDYIEKNGIDASALYYTDSPEFNGADLYVRDALQY